MPVAHPINARPWIVLATLVGAWLWGAAGDASACSSMSTRPACAPACGCCAAEPSPEGLPKAADVAAIPEPAPIRSAATCAEAPAGDCSCRPTQPASPDSGRRAKIGVERLEQSVGTVAGAFVPNHAPRRPILPLSHAAGSPPNRPLYLQTSRLLI